MAVTAQDMDKTLFNGSKYSHDTRVQVATAYLILGNIKKVSDSTNIPKDTVYGWTKSAWWEDLLTKVKEEKKTEIDANLTRMIDKAGQVIEDKLEFGDPIIHQGELMKDKKPVSAKDAAWIYGVLFDKQRLNRNEPTSISNNVSGDELAKLKAQFEELSGKTIQGERIEE